jgi:hypothetical protein
MKKIFLLLFSVLLLASCNQDKKADTVYVPYAPIYRWMDRQIYFAYSSGTDASRNNEFQKAKVQDALTEIAAMTNLGANYFTYSEVDEAVLQPIYEAGQAETEYKSFILIWSDADFNDFVVNTLGGANPDNNGVAVINAAYKRKFYLILKSSCFTSAAACNAITQNGLRALVARQLGLLVGMPILSSTQCAADTANVMCGATPNDEQWNDFNKLRWGNSFNNSLETILNNPNFYDEYQPPQ